jgi:hypothetical protein
LALADTVVVYAELAGRAAAKVLEDHVGAVDQIQERQDA